MSEPVSRNFSPPIPVLRVADLEASLRYYADALGFTLRWRWHTDFACISQGECVFFLTMDNQSQGSMWVWIGVPDCRALHARYVAAGARVRNPPNNFDWGLEMQIEDLDGNVLRMGSDREEDTPAGIWKDGDGLRWRRLPDGSHEQVA